MPEIIPIRDLKNTNAISQRCHETQEPIFVTKSGYGDMVIMSIRAPRMLSGEFLFISSRVIPWHIADYIDYYNNSRIQAKTKWMPPSTFRRSIHDGFLRQYRIILSADTASEVRQLATAKSADNTGCLIEHFGNADAVPQPPERCLSR